MEAEFLEMITEVLEIEDREIQLPDAFRDYDEWDSLARLTLIAEIDDKYNMVIEEEAFKNAVTLGDLLNEIIKRTQA